MRASSPLGPVRVKSWILPPSAVVPQSAAVMLAACADEAVARKTIAMANFMPCIVTPPGLFHVARTLEQPFLPGNMTDNLFTRFSAPALHRNRIFLAPPGRATVTFAGAFD